MFTLIDNSNNILEYKDYEIELDLTLNNVLLVFELEKDTELDEFDKIALTFELLVSNPDSYVGTFDILDLYEVVKLIFEKLSEKDNTSGEETNNENLAYDFNYDAERIYSSFLQEYNIDIIKVRDSMDWFSFIALFQNLGEKTPIMQAIYYRTCELPGGKEYAEERKRIKKAREYYELPKAKEEREKALVERLLNEAARI